MYIYLLHEDFDGYLAQSWISYNFGEPVLVLVCLDQSFVSL